MNQRIWICNTLDLWVIQEAGVLQRQRFARMFIYSVFHFARVAVVPSILVLLVFIALSLFQLLV